MPQSESIAKLVPALSKAQEKFLKISKDRQGQEGNLKFLYSTLPEGLSAVRQFLNKEGIFLSQPTTMTENGLRVITKVQLEDEWIASDGFPLPNIEPGKNLGKILTYGRRIDLFSFLSISGEDDDEDAPDLKPAPTQNNKFPVNGKPLVNQTPAKPTQSAKSVSVVSVVNGGQETQDKPVEAVSSEVTKDNPITDADLPDFDQPIKNREEWPVDAPDDVFIFRPLTPERNKEINTRLTEITSKKESGLDLRKLSKFLDVRHKGKRGFEVSSYDWEETFKLVTDAVESGPEAVKALIGQTKL